VGTSVRGQRDGGWDLENCSQRAGALGNGVVKALCYEPEGRGFDTR
jgi:hypothetical protein